ncbi:MAG TPA: lactate racemase domain-containing protein [Chroococcales cyanobacterium]|jgi:nickel-dependent lactate racemase
MDFTLDLGPLSIPERNFKGFFAPSWPQSGEGLEEEETIVREAVDYPFASKHLREMASEGSRALILIEDQTRPTRLMAILPPLIEELLWGGIEEADIRIAVASGAHRPMGINERSERLGLYARSFEVLDHHPDEGLVYSGISPQGTPLFFDGALFEADLIVAVGRIAPHRVMGYSGGTGILTTGMSGRPTIGELHWLSASLPADQVLGVRKNPAREESDSIAKLLHLDYVLNVILDNKNRIIAAFAGDPVEAHKAGCQASEALTRVHIGEHPAIVVCQPSRDQRFLPGSLNSLYSAERAVAEGGVIVLADPYIRLDARAAFPTIEEILERGAGYADKLQASHLAHVAWALKKAKIILACPQIPPELAEKQGFLAAQTPQAGLDLAFSMVGSEAEVALLDEGGTIVPL